MLKVFGKKKKNNKGFTLVELLVVIAIIGILAAVVAPNVFAQIEKSRVAATVADYQAVRTAVVMYQAENGNLTTLVPESEGKNGFDNLENYLDKLPINNKWDGTNELINGEDEDVLEIVLEMTEVPEAAANDIAQSIGGHDISETDTDIVKWAEDADSGIGILTITIYKEPETT